MAAPRNANQQVQVRQVLSVFVDNRCRCNADCQAAVGRPAVGLIDQPSRPQSYPVAFSDRDAAAAATAQCYHCIYPHHGHVPCDARGNSSPYSGVPHLHSSDDNAINQSIYMSSKEARARQLMKSDAMTSAVPTGGKSNKDASNATVAKDKEVNRVETEDTISAVGQSAKRTFRQQRQSTSSMEWPPPPPLESETPENCPELPASFDSVTLKRMLRSLSGSSPSDSGEPESKEGGNKGDASSRESKEKSESLLVENDSNSAANNCELASGCGESNRDGEPASCTGTETSCQPAVCTGTNIGSHLPDCSSTNTTKDANDCTSTLSNEKERDCYNQLDTDVQKENNDASGNQKQPECRRTLMDEQPASVVSEQTQSDQKDSNETHQEARRDESSSTDKNANNELSDSQLSG